jgi:dihydroorotase
MRLLIQNGRVIDPSANFDAVTDLLIADGYIFQMGNNLPGEDCQVLDATGLIVSPGFVDIHTHLREPGFSSKETFESGCRAAVKGGYTTVCTMPNTNPVADSAPILTHIKEKAKQTNLCHVYPIASITKEEKGIELAPMGDLAANGAIGFSDDGRPVEKASIMRLAAEYAKMFSKPLIAHCEDLSLAGSGVVNEGKMATRLGLQGIPAAAEEIIVARDIIIAKHTGAQIHFAHISTAGSVELIRQAKAAGIPVTAEATPHHFSLTEDLIENFDPVYKVNPPLRTAADVKEIIQGLKDGTIDAIATDHAPHTKDEKALEMDSAPFGISGLETAFAVGISFLYQKKILTLLELLKLYTSGPSQVLDLPEGSLAIGSPANITIFDADKCWTVDESVMESKTRRSPYHEMQLQGVVKYVFVDGREVYKGEKA